MEMDTNALKKTCLPKDVNKHDSARCDGVLRIAIYSDISVSNLVNEKEKGRREYEHYYINYLKDASLAKKQIFFSGVTHRNTLGIQHCLIFCKYQQATYITVVSRTNDEIKLFLDCCFKYIV